MNNFAELTSEDRERILAKVVVHFVRQLSPDGICVKDKITNTNWIMFMNPDDDLEMLIEETFDIQDDNDLTTSRIIVSDVIN